MTIKAKKYIMRAGVILTFWYGIIMMTYGVYTFVDMKDILEYYSGDYMTLIGYMAPSVIRIIAGILCVVGYYKLRGIVRQSEQMVFNSICNMEKFDWVIITLICAFPVSLLTFLPYICITER